MDNGGKLKSSWMETINAFLTTIVSVGMLIFAYAQWKVSEQQNQIAESLARLELAKSEPIFDVDASVEFVDVYTQKNQNTLAIPNEISLSSVELVRGIVKINASIILSLFDKNDEIICNLEFRGLYKEIGKGRKAILRKELIESLSQFLQKIENNGIHMSYNDFSVFVLYQNIFREPKFSRILSGIELDSADLSSALAVYSGAYSGGSGFYFDEGQPARMCPAIADQLLEAVALTGGHAGPL